MIISGITNFKDFIYACKYLGATEWISSGPINQEDVFIRNLENSPKNIMSIGLNSNGKLRYNCFTNNPIDIKTILPSSFIKKWNKNLEEN